MTDNAQTDSSESRYCRAASVNEVPPKTLVCREVEGVALVLVQVKGEFYALANLCSHARASFDCGKLRGFNLMCPLHGATFDVRTGAPTGMPARRPIASYPLRVCEGHIEVDVSSPTLDSPSGGSAR